MIIMAENKVGNIQSILEGRCVECNELIEDHSPYKCRVAATNYVVTNKIEEKSTIPTDELVDILLASYNSFN